MTGNPRKQLAIVLGMHRSGTSAITRALAALGADVGCRLMAPSESENPTGYWEDLDVYEINRAILDALGRDWHGLSAVGEDDLPLLRRSGFDLKAAEIIRQRTERYPFFALKDPRMPRLLSFWKPQFQQLGCNVFYVLALRNPLAVARSLRMRNDMDETLSYFLWACTTVASLRGTLHEECVVVDYDALIENPREELRRLAEGLGVRADASLIEEYVGSFLDEDLRHHRFSPDDLELDLRCPPLVRDIYDTLRGLLGSGVTSLSYDRVVARLPDWEAEVAQLQAPFGLIDRLYRSMAQARAAVLEADCKAQNSQTEVEALTDIRATLEAGLADAAQRLVAKDRELREKVSELDATVAALDSQVSELDATVAAMDSQRRALELSLEGLTEETVRRGAWALGLDVELQAARKTVDQLRGSTSWRVTYPLRAIKRGAMGVLACIPARGTVLDPWAVLRRTYHALPVTSETRERIKALFYAHCPTVCASLPSYRLWAAQQRSLARLALFPPGPTNLPAAVVTEHQLTPLSIELPEFRNPMVSVVIPCYGKVGYTLRCLAAIQANLPLITFEVIVVDDCSPDGSAEVLSLCKGTLLLRNSVNQGFIRSCNRGAAVAQGEFLCFLNNDTEVRAGWLDELYRTFVAFPLAGLAGSKLVYPDGSLQEAGGILWNDGSAWNFGRGQGSAHPSFNYARSVDYCSGASIMIRRDLFRSLGGFDEHYLPAYAEDSDLALKVQARGMQVIYQPLSVVVHHEGVTSGTDLSAGVKRYQVDNAIKLYERWKVAFETRHLPGVDVDAAKDRDILGRILVLDHCTPTPDQDAGSITALNFMLLLRQAGLQVTFAPEDNFLYMPSYTPILQRAGIEVLYAPAVRSVRAHLDEHAARYDLVLLFRPLVAERHLSLLRERCPRAKIVYHASDLHFLRLAREAQISGSGHEAAEKMQRKELALMRKVDCVVVHSSTESDLLASALPGVSVEVFQWAIPVPGTQAGFSARRDIAFIGGYQHGPNVDAVEYFLESIFPRIRSQLPGVKFLAIGSNPPEALFALAREDIQITGFVEDLAPVLDKVRVAVAPLRIGAGIKGKIGTTLSVGLPCVATTVAAEGMNLSDGNEILVVDDPDVFADRVVSLYDDALLWQRLSERGISFAEQNYGAAAAERAIRQILSAVGFRLPPSPFAGALASPMSRQGVARPCDDYSRAPWRTLSPVAIIEQAADFSSVLGTQGVREALDGSRAAEGDGRSAEFSLEGFCIPCARTVPFMVDMLSGGQEENGRWFPNWRERIECPVCRMNNRNRLVAALLQQTLQEAPSPAAVYFMEQVTPIFKWSRERFASHTLIGSEYLGHQYHSGDMVKGLRHEDAMALSFADASLDIVLSNDVFEHVPDPWVALTECYRVLRPGGTLLFTVPFDPSAPMSLLRARLDSGEVLHMLPPVYHGNPVSEEGSLVFTDFGCDLLDRLRKHGFSTAHAEFYLDPLYGHLGEPQIVFRALRSTYQIG